MNKYKLYEQYYKDALRTNKEKTLYEGFLYVRGKMFEEVGEIFGYLVEAKCGYKKFKKEKLIDEVGDLMWFFMVSLYYESNFIRETFFDKINSLIALKEIDDIRLLENIKNSIGKVMDYELLYKSILSFLNKYDISEIEVIKYNVKKLKKRHGESYNQSFYDNKDI